MKNAIKNSCGKQRGCSVVITLPYDRQPGLVLSGLPPAQYDLQKILPLAYLPVDKELEKKEPLEKMAA